ncbi:uncharacterized protein METZ01_LOCUS406791, partial [marine metagenome]
VRTVTISGGEGVAFNAESTHAPGLLGNIYMAAEGRRAGAAQFVAIAKGQNAFLDKTGGATPEGNPLVQVTRAEWRGKAPRVSTKIALAGRYIVFFPLTTGASVARRIGDAAVRERLQALAGRIAGDGEGGGITIRSAAEA